MLVVNTGLYQGELATDQHWGGGCLFIWDWHSNMDWLNYSKTPSIHHFAHSPIHPITFTCIHSPNNSFIHLFLQSLINLLVHPITYSLIHSFPHLIIYSISKEAFHSTQSALRSGLYRLLYRFTLFHHLAFMFSLKDTMNVIGNKGKSIHHFTGSGEGNLLTSNCAAASSTARSLTTINPMKRSWDFFIEFN